MLEQETLAEFITGGHYERYLRRVRRRNAKRREALLEAVQQHLRDRVEVNGSDAGAHVVLWPKRRISEKQVVARALKRGIVIYGLAPYHLGKPSRPGILLGYSRLSEREIAEGIRRLAGIL